MAGRLGAFPRDLRFLSVVFCDVLPPALPHFIPFEMGRSHKAGGAVSSDSTHSSNSVALVFLDYRNNPLPSHGGNRFLRRSAFSFG